MATIKKGSYRFNDTVYVPAEYHPVTLPINFTVSPKIAYIDNTVVVTDEVMSFGSITFYGKSSLYIYYSVGSTPGSISGEDNFDVYSSDLNGWHTVSFLMKELYDIPNYAEFDLWGQVITVTEDTPVDDLVYQLWDLNTEPVGNTPAVEITYKGEKIELSAGDIATLHIGGKKLTEDLVIKANEVTIPETPDNPLPIKVATESAMNALLATAEVGSVYKYIGTTGTYENGALYVVEESE